MRAHRVALLAAAVLSLSCSGDERSTTERDVPGQATSPSATIETKEVPASGPKNITKADDGKAVDVAVGQTLVLTLDETPGTGYHWELQAFDTNVLAKSSDEVVPPPTSSPPVAGAAYKHVWKFRAAGAGTTTLKLLLMPPGQGRGAEGEFGVTVKVA